MLLRRRLPVAQSHDPRSERAPIAGSGLTDVAKTKRVDDAGVDQRLLALLVGAHPGGSGGGMGARRRTVRGSDDRTLSAASRSRADRRVPRSSRVDTAGSTSTALSSWARYQAAVRSSESGPRRIRRRSGAGRAVRSCPLRVRDPGRGGASGWRRLRRMGQRGSNSSSVTRSKSRPSGATGSIAVTSWPAAASASAACPSPQPISRTRDGARSSCESTKSTNPTAARIADPASRLDR